jgi:hypothetical protein
LDGSGEKISAVDEVALVQDSFVTQPITETITCPSCGETLLYGDAQCRFCDASIDEDYARESAVTHAVLTEAAKSANIIRALRNLLYVVAVLVVLGVATRNSGTVATAFIVSILNIVAPIRWRTRYGSLTLPDADLQRAKKEMKRDLYLWGGIILVEVVVWFGLALAR